MERFKNSTAYKRFFSKKDFASVVDTKQPLIDQEQAQCSLVFNENTGFWQDALTELINSGDESCLSSPSLRKQNGSFAPSGLSVDELIALGTPRGLDTLVERDKYLDYLNSQIEIVEKKDPEPNPVPNPEPNPEPNT